MRCAFFLYLTTIVAIPYIAYASFWVPENLLIIPLKLDLILLGIAFSPLLLFFIPLVRSATIVVLPIIMAAQLFFIHTIVAFLGPISARFTGLGIFILWIVELLYLESYISYHILRSVITKFSRWKNRFLSLLATMMLILFIVFVSCFFIIFFYQYNPSGLIY